MKSLLSKIALIAMLVCVLTPIAAFAVSAYLEVDFFAVFAVFSWIAGVSAISILVFRYVKLAGAHNQILGVVRMLPVRLGVYDRAGRILFHHSDDESPDVVKGLKKVRDLPGIKNHSEVFINDLMETFKSGITKSRLFAYSQRRIIYGKIDDAALFTRDAVFSCSWDATPYFKAKDEMESMRRNYSTLVNAIDAGVIVLDLSGKVSDINALGARIIGRAQSSVIGMEYIRVFNPICTDEQAAEYSPLERILKNGGKYEYANSVVLPMPNEGKISLSLKCETVYNSFGNPETILVIFRDISRKESEKISERIKAEIENLTLELLESCSFKYNSESREILYEEGGSRFWPIRDGYPIPAKVWVYAADLDKFLRGKNRLISGEDKIWDCVYRSNYFGQPQWYRIRAVISRNEGDSVMTGTIQNIGNLRESFLRDDENAFMLRMIMKSIPSIFFIKDISNDYRYVMYSDKGYGIFGSSPETVIGKTDFEVFGNTEVARTFRKQDQRANNSQTAIEDHSDVPDKNGKQHHFHITEVAYPTGDGRKFLFGICLDETEENVIRNELDLQRRFYSELIDRLPVGILVKDADTDFKYVLWNKLLESHTGYPAASVLGKTDFEIEPYKDAAKSFRELDVKSMVSGGLISLDRLLTTASGKNIFYRTLKTAMRVDNRNYTLEMYLDVSREKALEAEQNRAVVKMNELVSNASIVNACLRRLARESDFSRSVKDMIRTIGNSMGVDRCYIYSYSEDKKTADCIFEWDADNIAPRKHREKVDMREFDKLNDALKNKRLVKIDNLGKSAHEWEKCRNFMEEGSVKSTIIIGIYEYDKPIGFIGADNISKDRPLGENDIKMLNNAISLYQLAKQRRQTIDEIRESVELQKTIIDTITIPVVMLNTNFTLVHANNAALDMMGKSLEEAMKHPCHDTLCRRSCPPTTNCSIIRAQAAGAPISAECEIGGKTYAIRAMPIFHNGKIVQILETFIDMTEANKSKALLRKIAEDAEDAAKAKSMFLATMSHELRTPLNSVIGFAELLKLGGMSKKESEDAVDSIYLSGSVLLQLINDVLDFSKLEAGQMKIVPRKTDLRAIINELSRIFEIRLKESNLFGITDIPSNLPLLYIDGLRFRQILLNIIGNSVKFTHKGGITIGVQFNKSDAEKGVLTVAVRDTGIGIAPEYIEKIFYPFVQQENRNGLVYQGTGLGLPICRKIVEQMNGTIEVKSDVGRGSCFTIKIPDVKYEKDGEISDKETDLKSCIAVLKGRVLLVDDVPMNLKVLESMMRKLGIETASVNSGEAALAKMQEFKPDIILTDMWMPKMNGSELLKTVKSDPNFGKVKVIAVTADAELENTKAEFDGILIKPLTIEKLRLTLSEMTPLNAGNEQ